ncbi:MAG: 1,2-phenylacetyl-CoA epoxidase subunit B [Bacteroidia bacterium]|nr:1,2-phenylacetyl-CoA epoxidase subunit B [Bacteroidia bacterium]
MENSKNWPLWEIFIRSKRGLSHKHVGSLRASDAQMAIENARDVYTRRQEGISIWVIESKNITASDPGEQDSLFDPSGDKPYRHPTFYKLPDELKNI